MGDAKELKLSSRRPAITAAEPPANKTDGTVTARPDDEAGDLEIRRRPGLGRDTEKIGLARVSARSTRDRRTKIVDKQHGSHQTATVIFPDAQTAVGISSDG